MLISRPESELLFERKGEEEIIICCSYGWISDSISKKAGLKEGENEILTNILETKFPKHAANYWSEDGFISRDLEVRNIDEWIENEICFLSGFETWFRENENGDDLSELISKAMGEDVVARAKIDFDRDRIRLVSEIPDNTLSKIIDINPAGKIAYRSIDMAIINALSKGKKENSSYMKKRLQKKKKPWWKMW